MPEKSQAAFLLLFRASRRCDVFRRCPSVARCPTKLRFAGCLPRLLRNTAAKRLRSKAVARGSVDKYPFMWYNTIKIYKNVYGPIWSLWQFIQNEDQCRQSIGRPYGLSALYRKPGVPFYAQTRKIKDRRKIMQKKNSPMLRFVSMIMSRYCFILLGDDPVLWKKRLFDY